MLRWKVLLEGKCLEAGEAAAQPKIDFSPVLNSLGLIPIRMHKVIVSVEDILTCHSRKSCSPNDKVCADLLANSNYFERNCLSFAVAVKP